MKKSGVLVILAAVVIICFLSVILGSDFRLIYTKVANYESPFKFLSQPKEIPVNKKLTLIAVGDVMLSRDVERAIKKAQDPQFPFLKIKNYLQSGDFTFGNLETPITAGPEVPAKVMVFRADPGAAMGLKQAGFSILSLANNHTPDFGSQGLFDTINYINQTGLKHVGAGMDASQAYSPVYVEKNGIKLAFLAYNDNDVAPSSYGAGVNHPGTALMDKIRALESIKQAKGKADFVIVSMHSGTEYVKKANARQIDFAHFAIDSGADLVIGHHPHVIQNVELYKGKYIFYSLGNFVFDQLFSLETRWGLTLKIEFTKDKIDRINLVPVFIESNLQTRLMNNEEVKKALEQNNLSVSYP